jgi:hypothetical protein
MESEKRDFTDWEFQVFVCKSWVSGFCIPYWLGIALVLTGHFDGVYIVLGYAAIVWIVGRIRRHFLS